jgi:hypothetical protein
MQISTPQKQTYSLLTPATTFEVLNGLTALILFALGYSQNRTDKREKAFQ